MTATEVSALFLGLALVSLLGIMRVVAVRDFRFQLLTAMMQAIIADGLDLAEPDQVWRFRAYDAVSFERMVLTFWRPLASFYPDQSFTRPR